ncbi:sensor domain-containing diguanylate cyclase [Agathobaculum sp. NTUH-O15-33]|uniref:sensor domain-containing diguanylate cyclase n=1 Tax=Agathobaculum sp. NTUH-O15-33 TaxID=3079302 RepID=UPI0029587FE6|nr:sensor domain-containing diguanylate cyclase [Agathobaculum sp. NTUH-O15-33]WNX85472.1 sensor domain-containing diguanylate cyclase [Agathobaculum sp. NTUH-O15-33]
MKNRILLRTNLLICAILLIGFLLTALLSYRANYSAAIENIEQVSTLTSEGIYTQINSIFTKPVNISMTMANDSLLKTLLSKEREGPEDEAFLEPLKQYLNAYRLKYGYDSVFLVSTATGRYYHFNGFDRYLEPDDPENSWCYDLLDDPREFALNVDNDEVAGAGQQLTIFVNCKILDEEGEIQGLIGVGLRIDGLQTMLSDYKDEFGVNAYLIDGNGTIQVSDDHSGHDALSLFEIDRYSEEVQRRILDWNETGSARSFWVPDETGAPQSNYVIVRYLPDPDWHLVVERDTGALMQELNLHMAQTVLIILAIIVVILFIVSYTVRNFNRQIVTLARTFAYEKYALFEKATEELYENIYELDITHNRPANSATEAYFTSLGAPAGTPFGSALHIIAAKQVKEEFRQGYIATFSPENVLRAYASGQDTLRYDLMISSGGQDYYWMRITARIVRCESDGAIHMLTYRQNIDAEKRQERRLRELAQADETTGLLTRSAIQRLGEQLLSEKGAAMYAFFLCDIDNFKQANDKFGHDYGDSVIRAFAHTMQGQFQQDNILGRLGGDEFAALVPIPAGHGAEWATEKANALSGALRFLYGEEDRAWAVSASIGVALANADTAGFDDLYKRAEHALYQTKKRGRDGYTIAPPTADHDERTDKDGS